jgi:hypothetical protein
MAAEQRLRYQTVLQRRAVEGSDNRMYSRLSKVKLLRNTGREKPMPTILGTTPRTWKSVRHIHELMFSIYFSLLLILADDVSSKWVGNPGDRTPWVLRMKFLLTGDYRTHSLVADPKLRLAFVFLPRQQNLWVVSGSESRPSV